MTYTYTIHDPVDEVPPVPSVNLGRDDWSHCYRAADHAKGRWVPIDLGDTRKARNLTEASKKQQGLEAERRGTTVFLRSSVGRHGR